LALKVAGASTSAIKYAVLHFEGYSVHRY
jgi:hypothetical protein